jgi:dipeptidyl aminopeptidase/acylaminoacyl peptidase
MRRTSAWYVAILFLAASVGPAQESVTWPSVSEQVSPLEELSIKAAEGHAIAAVARRPPGKGPFPAIIYLHGGLTTAPIERLKDLALRRPNPSRYLAAGYVIVIPTFRSRQQDPQTRDALADCLTVVDHVKKMPDVDRNSVVVYGCSGGGSLALELAGEVGLGAIAAEEPATVLYTGMFSRHTPMRGTGFEASDAQPIMEDPKRFYTEEAQKFTREKIRKITCPILIVQGDQHIINKINNELFIQELKMQGKKIEVITFAGERHCFGFAGDGSPQAASRLFSDCQAFFLKHLPRPPRPIAESQIRWAPVQTP